MDPPKQPAADWVSDPLALFNLGRQLSMHLKMDEMKLLADLAMSGNVAGTGHLLVESKISRGQEPTKESWCQEMLKQWKGKHPHTTNSILVQHLETFCKPEKVWMIRDHFGLTEGITKPSVQVSMDDSAALGGAGYGAAGGNGYGAAGGVRYGGAGAAHASTPVYVDKAWELTRGLENYLIMSFPAIWKELVRHLKNAENGQPAFEHPQGRIDEMMEDLRTSRERFARILNMWKEMNSEHKYLYHLTGALEDMRKQDVVQALVNKRESDHAAHDGGDRDQQVTMVSVPESMDPRRLRNQ